MKAELELGLRDLLERMQRFQETVDYARKEEPKNLDYVYLESVLGYWTKDLEKLIVTHKKRGDE